MAEETKTDDSGPEPEDTGQPRSRKRRMGEGIRQGIGVLSAFKDALEETIQEARERGDLSTERAKEVMREALDRAQSAAGDAKEKLDFAHHSELEAVRASVEALRSRVSALEQAVYGSEGGGDREAEGVPGGEAAGEGSEESDEET